jgi:PEP-CTERM motif
MQQYRCHAILIAVFVIGLNLQHAQAALVYFNDFEGIVGPEWSSVSTDLTPLGSRRFLGQFSNNTISLTLTGMPTHTEVALSFDVFLLLTWDGNNLIFGPDLWSVAVDNGPTLLQTTFSNAFSSEVEFRQAYPDAYPGGDHPGLTGAAELDTLGYPDLSAYAGANDAVYRLSFTFPHVADSLRLTFSGTGLEGLGDESWGLDTVQVRVASTSEVSEPSTLLLFGSGAALGWLKRHKLLSRPG